MKKYFSASIVLAIMLAACLAIAGCGSGSTKGSSASQSSESATAAPQSKYSVTIDEARTGTDYNGGPAVVVTYSWQNNSDETRSYASTLHAKCFQDGVQLEPAILSSGIDSDGYMADVRPGYGTTFQLAYKLTSQNDVEVEVGELASFSKEILAKRTFSFQ